MQQLKVINNTIKELKDKNTITLNILEQNTDNEAIITTRKSIKHILSIANNIKIEAKHIKYIILSIESNETGTLDINRLSRNFSPFYDRKN